MLILIGAINIDLIATTLQEYMPQDSNPAKISLSVGGVAMNYARNLRLLGEPIQMLTVVADDILGQIVRQECQKMDIDLSRAITIPNTHSNLFIGVHNYTGELEAAAADVELVEQHLTPDYLSSQLHHINSSPLVMADTNLSETAITYLLDHCTAPLMMDGVSMRKTQRLVAAFSKAKHPRLHTLKLNRQEYELFMSESSPLLLEHIDNLLISEGAEGVKLIKGNKVVKVPALPVSKIVSTLGAGDALLSGWAFAYTHQLPDEEALNLAQRMAVATMEVRESVNPNVAIVSLGV